MNQIDILNNKLISSLDDTYPIGLVDGKMGLCLYYYYLYRWGGEEEKFKQIADKLLDDVVSQLSETMDVTVDSGLAGIAIGISHLVKEKFIGGDINEILEDIDNTIFKKLAFLEYINPKKPIPKEEYIRLLYYLYLRYEEQSSSDDKYILQELMIKTIEMFKHDLQGSFFIEHFSFSLRNFHLPFFLYVISKIYNLNIYNDRIIRILEEYINQILSIIPILHVNRLYLLCGLLSIQSSMPSYKKEIDSHIRLIIKKIDIDYLINIELKNQDIYMISGVSLVYVFLFYIQTKYPSYKIAYSPQLFFNKIINSEAWDTLLRREFYFYNHIGLFDGFPGANLVLLHIKKHFS